MKGLWTSRSIVLLIDSFHVQWFDSCEHPKTGVGYCFHFLEITLATKLTSPSLSWVNLVVGQYFYYRLPINSWIIICFYFVISVLQFEGLWCWSSVSISRTTCGQTTKLARHLTLISCQLCVWSMKNSEKGLMLGR